MSIRTILSGAVATALGFGIDEIVSVKKKEIRGLKIAQRFSRGNTNIQHGRTVTEADQRARLDGYVDRVIRKSFFFQK